MSLLTPEVADAARRSVLCWFASVGADGQPNVSPKEIFAIVDERHLVVANIASPGTVRNVAASARVCVAFVDVFVQKGFKVHGLARHVRPGDAGFEAWAEPLKRAAGPRFPIHGVLLVEATAVEPIVAPSYRLYPAETTEEAQRAAACRTYGVVPAPDAS